MQQQQKSSPVHTPIFAAKGKTGFGNFSFPRKKSSKKLVNLIISDPIEEEKTYGSSTNQ